MSWTLHSWMIHFELCILTDKCDYRSHLTACIIIFWCINGFNEVSHETRISYEYECDWIWVFKCHLVNSCVRLYEFGYELEMSLSLRESLRMYSGIVLQFLLYYTTSLKIVCEWAWVFRVWLWFGNEFELEREFENVQWYCTSVLVVLYNECEDSLWVSLSFHSLVVWLK